MPAKRSADMKPLSHQSKHFTSSFGHAPVASASCIVPPESKKRSRPPATKNEADVIELSSDSEIERPSKKRSKVVDTPKSSPKKSKDLKGKGKATEYTKEDEILWIDRFSPADLTELAVHKKKVADVQHWLEEALDNPRLAKYRRLLILSGPTGSAKTATIRALSREMSFDLLEFRSSEGADSLTTQFNSFLARAAAVPMLDFSETNAADSTPTSKSKATAIAGPSKTPLSKTFGQQTLVKERPKSTAQTKRKVILVEDLPNVFTSDVTKSAFRTALTRFVQHNRGYASGVPMVLIVSETIVKGSADEWHGNGMGGQSSWSDNLSVRNLVPLDVLKGGKALEIKFNPIAITFMRKALENILDKAYPSTPSKKAKRSQRPSAEAVELIALAANGDIRNALNNLQFLVKEGDRDSAMIQYSIMADVAKSQKKSKRDKNPRLNNADLFALIGGREASLFLFHALGKVLFSKRWGESPDDDAKDDRQRPPKTESLPTHLNAFARKTSKVDPNTLFADAPVDCDLFMAYLHQNYPAFNNDIDQCVKEMEYFSQADAMSRSEGERFTRHPLSSQYSFHIAVRGMMISLPSPVPRRGQKMLKSEMWENSRKAKDNDTAVATLTLDLARSLLASEESQDGSNKLQSLLTRRVLVRELVPFLGIIKQPFMSHKIPQHTSSIVSDLTTYKDLATQKGQLLDEREAGDSDGDDHENDAVDRAIPADEEAPQMDVEPKMERLYLEEDDIEQF